MGNWVGTAQWRKRQRVCPRREDVRVKGVVVLMAAKMDLGRLGGLVPFFCRFSFGTAPAKRKSVCLPWVSTLASMMGYSCDTATPTGTVLVAVAASHKVPAHYVFSSTPMADIPFSPCLRGQRAVGLEIS